MPASGDMTESLDALVSGKRRVPRHTVRLEVTVKGVHRTFPAEVHDLSIDGALVSLDVGALDEKAQGPLGPAEQFGLLETHFRDTFDLQFDEHDVVVETQVVRLLVSPYDEQRIAVGCRFVESLTPVQQERLGMPGGSGPLESWGDASLAHGIERVGREDRPVAALILDDSAEERGPARLAPVVAIGRDAVTLRLPGVPEEEARRELGERRLDLRLRRGTQELLAGPARLVALRYTDAPAPGVECMLALEAPLPRGVRRCFRRV